MKMISLTLLTLAALLLASCSHGGAAADPTTEAANASSPESADKRACSEVAERYIRNIVAGNVKAADADRAGMRNGHTSEELVPMIKGFGPLDHLELLSVDKGTAPDAERATVEGLMYFKNGRHQHYRAEEQKEQEKWKIFEFSYSN